MPPVHIKLDCTVVALGTRARASQREMNCVECRCFSLLICAFKSWLLHAAVAMLKACTMVSGFGVGEGRGESFSNERKYLVITFAARRGCEHIELLAGSKQATHGHNSTQSKSAAFDGRPLATSACHRHVDH